MHKDLGDELGGDEGFDKCKKQYADRQRGLRDHWKAKAKHSAADKGSGEIDHNGHFSLTAPARTCVACAGVPAVYAWCYQHATWQIMGSSSTSEPQAEIMAHSAFSCAFIPL